MTRRDILRLGKAVLVITGLYALYPVSRYLNGGFKTASALTVAKKDLLQRNEWQKIGDSRAWLRQGQDGVEGILATCTHLGCEVRFEENSKQWVCPCHGSRFAENGELVQGPTSEYDALKLQCLDCMARTRKAQGLDGNAPG